MAAHNDLEFQSSLIEAIKEASPDGILVADEKGLIIFYNQRVLDIFGVPALEVVIAKDGTVTHLDETMLAHVTSLVKNKEAFLKRVLELYANPQLDDHYEIELKDGRFLDRYSKALWGKNQQYLGRVWFFRDITEYRQLEHQLKDASQQDPLTGVANRRYFFERAADEFSRAQRFKRDLSLVMLDIDLFKKVNDRWGHDIGDRVIQSLCETINSILREVDLLARIGGEEFVVIVPDTNIDGAFQLAERLRQSVAASTIKEGEECITFTISAGVAAVSSEDMSIQETLKRADTALYAAKNAGRNKTMRAT
jgi:diguanylate cyclase (GGDEF)-like protein